MMIYLSNHNHLNIFDWLNDSNLVKQPFMLKKMSSNQFDLCSFAQKEALSINIYQYLAIDLSSITNTPDAFISSVGSILRLNPKICLLFVDIGSKYLELQQELFKNGKVQIITVDPRDSMSEFKEQVVASFENYLFNKETEKEEILESTVIGKGNNTITPLDDKVKRRKKLYDFTKKDVTIAIINAEMRCGATTLSLNVASFLNSIGAKVAYIECNSELGHLEQIISSQSGFTQIKDNRFDRNGIIYMKNELPEGIDFLVADMSRVIGAASTNAIEWASQCDMLIICGTCKPYELNCIKETIDLFSKYNCDIKLCLSFAVENQKAYLVDFFTSSKVSVFFTNYTPDYFNFSSNADMFFRLLGLFLKEKCQDNLVKIFA